MNEAQFVIATSWRDWAKTIFPFQHTFLGRAIRKSVFELFYHNENDLQSSYYWLLSFSKAYEERKKNPRRWLIENLQMKSHSRKTCALHSAPTKSFRCWSQIKWDVFCYCFCFFSFLSIFFLCRNLQKVLKQQMRPQKNRHLLSFQKKTDETTYRSSNLEIRCFNLACDDAYWNWMGYF